LWFLSDRTYRSVVGSIWGSRQPEPFFDRPTKIYGLSLRTEFRSPFAPPDELHAESADEGDKKSDDKDKKPAKGAAATPAPGIDLDGIQARLIEAPVAAGNLGSLSTDGKNLYWTDRETTPDGDRNLRGVAIGYDEDEATIVSDVAYYELTADRKKLLVRKADDLYVVDAKPKAVDKLGDAKVKLDGWTASFDPRVEWKQMFTEAWRLERDYFYDRAMHGVDWKAMYAKYLPLAERVTDRAELSDVFGQMVGELSALHMYVYGGDFRRGDRTDPSSLGAVFERDEAAGGHRITRIWRTDPDRPERLAPLARPDLGVREGDVLLAVNGVPTLGVADVSDLLRQQSGRQVLLRIARGAGAPRDLIVEPVTIARENDIRYDAWEYERRLRVDSLSAGRVGYVHLRAMGAEDMAQWEREFYPVFERDGLVIDVRNNRGGNIDAWIISRLLRKAWMYWQPRAGRAFGNMPFAFRGKVVVLVNEHTISDGEAFAEGVRRLGLGKVVGARTWGGEIWLSQDNFLVDRGIATAAETGVYAPEGVWMIEGHGVDPDVVVDNLPHETFLGRDAQLEAAVRTVLEEAGPRSVPVPGPPKYPNKSRRR
jgi:tricorn protease